MRALVGLLAICVLTAADAPPPRSLIFACSLSGNKQVSVRAVGRDLIYRFGTRGRTELTIVGNAERRNLFYWWGRYSNIAQHLRFTNGRFSYTVFSVGPNPSVGARGVAGVMVRDGHRPITDMVCRRWTELHSGIFEEWGIPQDDDEWTAM